MAGNLKKLAEPFAPEDIEWRVQQSGMKGDKPWARVLAYVQNRAIMQRLDDVCGPEKWANRYKEAPNGGVLCGISIKCGDAWITKWDGAENTDIEAVKGGLSNSMKRAAVQWGIGRYLYKLEATFAEVGKNKGDHWFQIKKPKTDTVLFSGYWNTPELPKWAVPGESKGKPQSEAAKVEEIMTAPEADPLDFLRDELADLLRDGLKQSPNNIRAAIGKLKTKEQLEEAIAKTKAKIGGE